LHGGSSAGKSDLCCGRSLDVVGRPGLHQSGLVSNCFADCSSPGPRKNDLTIYWAPGPFVRSFTLLVDPGDIYPPHSCIRMCKCTISSGVTHLWVSSIYASSCSSNHLTIEFPFLPSSIGPPLPSSFPSPTPAFILETRSPHPQFQHQGRVDGHGSGGVGPKQEVARVRERELGLHLFPN
jgi:hypothetical protein